MRLLDAPMVKTAADMTDDEKKAAMAKILIGAGGGAGLGALTQYLITGKAGLAGAGIGAAGGAAVGAGLDENVRERVKRLFKAPDKKVEDQPTTAPAVAKETTDGKPLAATTTEKRQELPVKQEEAEAPRRITSDEFWKERGESIQYVRDNPDQFDVDTRKAADNQLKIYDALKTYETAEEKAPQTLAEINRLSKDHPELFNTTIDYLLRYKDIKGDVPDDSAMKEWLGHLDSGKLQPTEYDQYIRGKHDIHGQEGPVNWAAESPQLAEFGLPLVANRAYKYAPGLSRKSVEYAAKKSPQIVSSALLSEGGKRTAEAMARRQASKELGEAGVNWAFRNIPGLRSIPGLGKGKLIDQAGKAALERHIARKGGQEAIKRGMFSKLVSGPKGGSPGFLALNLLLDAPNLFVDPETGDWNMDWMKNAVTHDKMMEIRERSRTMLQNSMLGGARGLVSPWTALMPAGARLASTRGMINTTATEQGPAAARRQIKDVLSTFVPFMGNYQAKHTSEENLANELRRQYVHRADKKTTLPGGQTITISQHYDPREYERLTKKGYKPVLLPNGKYGYQTPRGNYRGQTEMSEEQRRELKKAREAIMGVGAAPVNKLMQSAPARSLVEVKRRQRAEAERQKARTDSRVDDYVKSLYDS